jgi:hypothetical protein
MRRLLWCAVKAVQGTSIGLMKPMIVVGSKLALLIETINSAELLRIPRLRLS